MLRKLLKILLIIPVLYLVIIPVFLASSANSKPCGGIIIDISDSSDYHFVTKKQLINLAYGNSSRIAGKPVKEVSISAIENRINILHELKKAEVHIVEGNVSITSAMLSGVSVLDTVIKHSILKDLYQLVNYINDDKFWSAQIDQIYVDGNDEIDLIPRTGNQVVHLGSTENYEGKLRNLSAFYDKVLPEVGWNKYSVINLEFKDQIVCKRRDNQK